MYPGLCCIFYVPTFTFVYMSCDFFQFFYMLIVGVEQWSKCFLAVNRFIGIFLPHLYQTFASCQNTIAVIVISWIVPLIITLLILLQIGGKSAGVTQPWNGCIVQPLNGVNWALHAVNYVCTIIPLAGTMTVYLAILLGSYFGIFCRHAHRVDVHAALPDRINAMKQKVKRVKKARMLFVSVLWYLVCYLPHTIIVTTFSTLYFNNPPLGLWMRTIYLMGFAGSPFIFLIMSQEYRRRLVLLILQFSARSNNAHNWGHSNDRTLICVIANGTDKPRLSLSTTQILHLLGIQYTLCGVMY
ncbi:trace amine-associated receptor 8b-like [Paramacrobiotus metropolitanus]|uniref:trace amine-associated receptor 8b-like n=1 Tax=Paramacrobiotus metropolitanus TaxID=2943436 RepID=UPI002445994D|nr:trace amine-associated receptor 8b-like [Paramacrobiotus metropolitanus]